MSSTLKIILLRPYKNETYYVDESLQILLENVFGEEADNLITTFIDYDTSDNMCYLSDECIKCRTNPTLCSMIDRTKNYNLKFKLCVVELNRNIFNKGMYIFPVKVKSGYVREYLDYNMAEICDRMCRYESEIEVMKRKIVELEGNRSDEEDKLSQVSQDQTKDVGVTYFS